MLLDSGKSLIKPYSKDKLPALLARLIRSFSKKISTPTGSIFFEKTLQFPHRTAFLVHKLSLMIKFFYEAKSNYKLKIFIT
jgi:hypothetical protein